MSQTNRKDETWKNTLEEVTSSGEGSGLEVEQSEGVGRISYPFDPEQIDVTSTNPTVDLLITRLKEDELKLSPDFQRRDNLWTEDQKSSLIESILLRIPIPSFYVSEEKNGDYAVVDGLQRLCSIAHFVNYSALNKAVGTKLNALRLQGLESLTEYENKSFDELPRPLQRRITETELTLHVIRPSTPSDVKFNIFSRINRGGLPLTPQEIRNAIYKGKWRDVVRKLAKSSSFMGTTGGRIKGERMQDYELVLRFIAHYLLASKKIQRPSEGNLDPFLNNFVDKDSSKLTDADWENVELAFYKALDAAPKVFGDMAFRKYSSKNESKKPINRGLFEAETVALACRAEREIIILAQRSNQVIDKIKPHFDSNTELSKSLLYATGRGNASNARIKIINQIFDEVLK